MFTASFSFSNAQVQGTQNGEFLNFKHMSCFGHLVKMILLMCACQALFWHLYPLLSP